MRDLRPILLVEDNPKDAELTMAALARCQLLNDVTHVRDGVEALEYLRCQGRYEGA
ncbi:MAG: response regulator, partial [Stenotrophomonas maltophilia]